MIFSRRTALQLGSGALGGAIIGAPAAARTAAPSVPRPRRLSLLLPRGSEANVQPLVDAFAAAEGVDITVQSAPVDEVQTVMLLQALGRDRTYDICLPPTFAIPDLVEAGTIMPLDDLVRAYEPEGFRRTMLYRKGEEFDGRFYGYQTDGDAYVMFVNETMRTDPAERGRFEDRHGEALRIPRTWDELDRQMAFFHRPDAGRFGGSLFRASGYLGWEWWLRMHAKGVWPLGPDGTPQVASDAGIAALDEMISSQASLYPDVGGLVENWRLFSSGVAYANTGWGGTQKHLRRASAPAARFAAAQTPGGRSGDAPFPVSYFNWGWTYVLMSGCADPDLAFQFCLHAAGPAGSTTAVRQASGFFDPFRDEHYEDDVIAEVYSDPFLTVHRGAMADAMPDFYLLRRADYFGTLNAWIARALKRVVDPATALRRVGDAWHGISHQAGADAQAARWRALRRSYPTGLQAALRDQAT